MRKKLLIVALVTLCFGLQGKAFSEDTKMGFVDMKKLFYDYKKTKDFNKELEKEDEAAKNDLEERSKSIRKLRDEIDLLSDEAKEKKQPELRAAMQKLDDYRKGKVESFMCKKDEMFGEIRKDIIGVASEYAKKNKYNIILDGSVFVYSSDNLDVTDAILNKLNEQ